MCVSNRLPGAAAVEALGPSGILRLGLAAGAGGSGEGTRPLEESSLRPPEARGWKGIYMDTEVAKIKM